MRYLSADVGGTFTDLVLLDGDGGAAYVEKVPSERRGSAAPIVGGLRRILRQAGLEPTDLHLFVHGFTVATNAFLMRSGARAALVVTQGFRDVLEIGDQLRPKLYGLRQPRRLPVVPRDRIVEAAERVGAHGETVLPLAEAEAARVAEAVAALQPEAVAVCLGFSHLDPTHERRLRAALAARLPGVPLYLSSEVNPQIEEYPRANTTAIAAYVGPITDRYVSELEQGLAGAGLAAPLLLMRSDGGVATARAARDNPAHMLLSGPAGGVVAGVELGRRLGIADIVTFDMGGTSADFSAIVAGEARRVPGRRVDGQPLRLPTLDIETISAGGGSIGWVDRAGALRVGPQSAGAVPGPACYGTGGSEPTVTDAAVVLGLLAPADYLGGEVPLQPESAHLAIAEKLAAPLDLSVEEAAAGMLQVANARMAQAIRSLSVERGLDVRRFALLAFGGAGPLAACWLAESLGMAEVVVPRHPGVFAAEGLLMGDIRHSAQAAWRRRLEAVRPQELAAVLSRLREGLDAALAADGVPAARRLFHFGADLRHVGQFHEIERPLAAPDGEAWWDPAAVAAGFVAAHERLYGHADPSAPIEIVNLRVEAVGALDRPVLAEPPPGAGRPLPYATRPVCLDPAAGFFDCPLYARADLAPGAAIEGPCIVTQRDSTTVVLPGQRLRVDRGGVLRIARAGQGSEERSIP